MPAQIRSASRMLIWSVGLRLTPSPDSIVIVRYGHRERIQFLQPECGRGPRRAHQPFCHLQRHSRHVADPGPGSARHHHHRCARQHGGQPVRRAGRADQLLPRPVQHALQNARRHGVAEPSLAARQLHPFRHLADPGPRHLRQWHPARQLRNGIYATFNWAHEFSPNTAGGATVQYGRATSGQIGSGNTASGKPASGKPARVIWIPDALAATLSHRLSETLTTSIQVAWTSSTSSQAGQGYTQGVIRAGLRRTF